MATIRNTETNEITELTMLSDSGTELMADILGNYGIDFETIDGERVYLLDTDGIEWWTRWIEREEAIADAFADCEDEETIAAYWQAIDENQGDLERMQDELERILGITDDSASAASLWKRNQYLEPVRVDGSAWLEYGAFGRDTYGLHVDGSDYVYNVRSAQHIDVPSGYDMYAEAERIIKAIAEGRA